MLNVIRIGDAAKCQEYLYFSNVSSNGLYRIHIHSHNLEFVDFFPKEKAEAELLHKRCFAYGQKIVFIPALSRRIVIYDVDSHSFEHIEFDNDVEGEAVMDAALVGNSIYIFKRNVKCELAVLNLETMQLDFDSEFGKLIDKYISSQKPDKFYRAYYSDRHFYFGLCGSDMIAIWNIGSNAFDVIHTGENRIINITKSRDKIFFSVRDKYGIGVVDLLTKNVRFIECDRSPKEFGNIYGCMFLYNNCVMVAPAFGSYIHGFKNEKMVYENHIKEEKEKCYKFYRYLNVLDDIWLLPIDTDELYILKPNMEIQHFMVTADNNTQKIVLSRLLKEKNSLVDILYENKRFELSDFLDALREG